MTPGILPILLHPPSTEADRVKAIKDRGGPERSRTCRIMIVVKRSMNVRRRDAAKLHAPLHEMTIGRCPRAQCAPYDSNPERTLQSLNARTVKGKKSIE